MIKILIIIIILIMSTASGTIAIGLTTTNDFGITFTDSLVMNGDVSLNGQYLLSTEGVFENMGAQVGIGNFAEHTRANRPGTHHQGFDFNDFKSIENDGTGTAYSSTSAFVNAESAGICSYLQTDSGIDHGEMIALASNGAASDFTKMDWHFENVQAESEVSGSSWDDHSYSTKTVASPYQ